MVKLASWVQTAGGKAMPWNDEFPLGAFTLETLLKISRDVDGAVVIVTAKDLATKRGSTRTPRDNVLLELGMFVSALSPRRVAIVSVLDEQGTAPKLPRDLDGLAHVIYDPKASAEAKDSIWDWISEAFTARMSTNEPQLAIRNGAVYTWEDVTEGVQHIQHHLERDDWLPDVVLGLGRSGGVIGGLLAAYLGSIPLRTLDLTYSDLGRGYGVEIQDCRKELSLPAGGRVLIVEGATTSGLTPNKAEKMLKAAFPKVEFKFGVLIQGATSNFRADYYAYLELCALDALPWHGPRSKTFLKLVGSA